MTFVTLKFILFVVFSVLLYYILPKKMQWISLLFVSTVFYLCAGVKAVVFIYVTTLITFCTGIRFAEINGRYMKKLMRHPEYDKKQKAALRSHFNKRKRFTLALVLFINFGILFILKYFRIIEGAGQLFAGIFNVPDVLKGKNLILPLGISYYTFQSCGYLIDLYRNKYDAERNFFRYALFITFFPQLVQGPISRYDELNTQIYKEHPFEYDNIKFGIQLMFWGYFKKLVIADRIACVTDTIMGSPDIYKGFYIVFASAVSWVELYMDFSAGTDIARGTAQLFGIILPDNFHQPLFAESIADFWRRWHISLNNWWRDYIFYPLRLSQPFKNVEKGCRRILGNSIGKKIPNVFAMIFVRVVNGMWHGANPIYMIGGLYHGVLMGMAFLLEKPVHKLTKKMRINTECLSWKIIKILRTYIIISVPRVISKSPDLAHAIICIRYMFAEFNPWILFDGSLYQIGVSQKEWGVITFSLLIVFAVSLVQEKGYSFRVKLKGQNTMFRWMVYVILSVMLILFGAYGSGYDAASFQYAQF